MKKNISRYFLVIFVSTFLSFQTAYPQWEPCSNELSGLPVTSIVVKDNSIYAGTIGGGFFLSTNNGDNWIPKNEGLLDSSVVSIACSGNNIFTGTRSAGMFLSTNNGDSWTEKNNGFINSSVWSIAASSNFIYAGTRDSGIFLSTDIGEKWSRVNNQLIYIRSLLIDSNDVIAGTYNSGMYISTDQGGSWLERNNGLDDIDVRCLGIKGNDLFAGTSALGIFHTTDKGLNWHYEIIGADRYGSVWAVAFAGDNIFLGSYDRGVYLSTDNGTTWIEKNSGITDTSVTLLAVNDKYIFAETEKGILRAKLNDMITNINESAEEIFNISPNPASDFIEISYPPLERGSGGVTFKIYNIYGQITTTPSLRDTPPWKGGEKVRIDISPLAPGMYFIRIGGKVTRFVKI
jgi:photosystem II stability/assembly factor-like uncharacterized protein